MTARRRPTSTSAFGVGRRESHDASAFYARFDGPTISSDETVERCGSFDVDQLAQTAPVLDLLHAGHDRLYSRLFQS